ETVLREVFGADAEIKTKNILLTEADKKAVAQLAKHKVEQGVYRFYQVHSAEKKLLGYGGLFANRVRTKNQTCLYIMDAKGNLKDVEVIAFNEPPEYKAPEAWLKK